MSLIDTVDGCAAGAIVVALILAIQAGRRAWAERRARDEGES